MVQLSDFKSMSLVGSTYKIISKCLALRLKEVSRQLCQESKGPFFKGKLYRMECFARMNVLMPVLGRVSPEVLYKMDLKKAYDHAN